MVIEECLEETTEMHANPRAAEYSRLNCLWNLNKDTLIEIFQTLWCFA